MPALALIVSSNQAKPQQLSFAASSARKARYPSFIATAVGQPRNHVLVGERCGVRAVPGEHALSAQHRAKLVLLSVFFACIRSGHRNSLISDSAAV